MIAFHLELNVHSDDDEDVITVLIGQLPHVFSILFLCSLKAKMHVTPQEHFTSDLLLMLFFSFLFFCRIFHDRTRILFSSLWSWSSRS